MLKLHLNTENIEKARASAQKIVTDLKWLIDGFSSTTIERTILRLFGIDDATADGTPYLNIIVDILNENKMLDRGAAYHIANAIAYTGKSAQETANDIVHHRLNIAKCPTQSVESVIKVIKTHTDNMLAHINKQTQYRENQYHKYGDRKKPAIYVIVATGNIYDDIVQAKAAAKQGADIIAVIRSTAQSLLDYVPHGATTEGFGGTFATQENFRLMRAALDETSDQLQRYISLTNYASGLCMPEIAAMGAIERLDCMLNDAMYGILFRDINPRRTILDQYFARIINGYAGIEIQTGEDNYLTTSDAIEKAYTVTASQLINEQFALLSGVKPEKMGIGHAFEIDPEIEDALSFEIAHAMLTKHLFPVSPTKYMPPTKFITGNIFKAHIQNAMFNLTAQITGQEVQLLGMLTEAVHTPHIQDRQIAIENAQYIFNTARTINQSISISSTSPINKRANAVLKQATKFLEKVAQKGLLNAMAQGEFADIKRPDDRGKGLEGVFKKSENYMNPFIEKMKNS